jgi:hypothetical protein
LKDLNIFCGIARRLEILFASLNQSQNSLHRIHGMFLQP